MTKIRLVIVALTCLTLSMGAIGPSTAAPMPACKPWLVSHQGNGSGHSPNTLGAFRWLAADRHIKWIETDTFRTRDGVNLIIHDDNLFPSTGKPGYVSKRTHANIRRHYRTHDGSVIPTTRAALRTVRAYPRVKLVVEVKDRQRMRPLVRQIKATKMLGRTFVYSTDREWMVAVHKRFPKLRVGWKAPANATPNQARFAGLVTMPGGTGLTRAEVRAMQDTRAIVFARESVENAATYTRVRRTGVDGILTDVPRRYLRWCR
jgi:glycerophosphoryl diester phosphodiesterase